MTATSTVARFGALGTYVHVGVDDPRDVAEAERIVRVVLERVDLSCSRFRPDSDLSRANGAPGTRVGVDPVLSAAVAAAVYAAADTDGLVDPLLGRAMVALGYDRDFDLLRPRALPASVVSPVPGAWRRLEWGEDWVRVPEGSALDLGSVGKAWASDLAAATVQRELGIAVLVSVGGDVAVRSAGSWPVELRERPDDPAPQQTVWVEEGGLATSSTRVRRWSSAGVVRHHVLDPRTGQPAPEVWRTVTATGPTCAAANAAATAAVVLGVDAVAWLEHRSVDARLVAADGTVRLVGAWPAEEQAA